MDDVLDFDAPARGFSVRTAYYLAHASRCAYETDDALLARLGLDDFAPFTRGQFHGFVGFIKGVALVAFRGTENTGNFLTDAETPLITHSPYPGRVHVGFAEAVETVWPSVRELLGRPSRKTPLWVTGHSLGGAMATLASVRLADEGYTVRAVYTYGSPRPGDQRFQQAYQLPNYRLVHDNDLVPHLPFRWCYKHVGDLKLLDEHGNIIEDSMVWKGKKRTHRRTAKLVHRAHRGGVHQEPMEFDWLSDHKLANYLAAIDHVLSRVPRRRRFDRPHTVQIRSRRVELPTPEATSPPPDFERRRAG